jgi:alpha-galactosidase
MHAVFLAIVSLLASSAFGAVAEFSFRASLEVDGKQHAFEPGRATQMVFSADGVEVEWRRDAGLISATLHNTSAAPKKLGRLVLAQAAGVPGDRALVMSGWQSTNLVQSTAGKKLVSKTLLQLWDPAGAPPAAVQFGFITFDRISTEIEIEGGVVSAVCDFEGFALAPGATIASEQLRIARDADPITALQAWGAAAAAHYRPRIWPTTPAGWVGWSWVDPFNSERYEDVVRRNARAIREKLPGADIGYIWVSIGNLQDREPGAWLDWNRASFPSGPQALVRDLDAQGFKLGLWAGAYWVSSRLESRVAQLRDAFLLKDGQPMTVPHRDLGPQFILDPTHPKTHAWFNEVFRTWREWGVRYYMIDFVHSVSGSTPGRFVADGYFNKALVPSVEAMRDSLKVIRAAAGDDTYLLISTGPTFQTVGLLDAVRAGTDYGEGRPIDGPGKGFFPATFVVNKADYWTSHLRAVQAWATHFFAHRKLFIADSGNVLTIDKPVPLIDAQISATIFGLNGSPLMIGDDVDRMAPERLAMLRQQFPRLPEAGEPLDLFNAIEPDHVKTFRLRVKTAWDAWELFAVFNFSPEPLRKTLPAAGAVWDFWDERYTGVATGALDVIVPPRSVKLLRVAPARAHPWILSTDIHIRQGQAELSGVAWDESALELRFTAARAGNVFLRVPKEFRLAEPAGLWIAKDGNDSSLLVRVAADAGERRVKFVRM